MSRLLSIMIFVLIVCVSSSQACHCCSTPEKKDQAPAKQPPSKIDEILLKLNNQNARLKTYQAKIDYVFFDDPELLPDSKNIRTGKIYYKRSDKTSNLVIKFDTFTQDDEKPEKRKVEWFFDGAWLKKIDYKNKTVTSYQKAREDKPVDAFELINRDFPMLGFNNKENLRKHFDISMASKDKKDSQSQVRLHLKVKKGSPYAKNYTSVDLRIDKKTFLPARIITISTEGYIYDIKMHVIKVNKNLKDSVFMLETPTDFRENKHPMKKS